MKHFSLTVLAVLAFATAALAHTTGGVTAPTGPGLDIAFVGYDNSTFTVHVDTVKFDVEQTLSIGSASSGAGAGKITFNPFSFTKKIDATTPVFFTHAASGQAFKTVTVKQGSMLITLKLAAVRTQTVSLDGSASEETITLEYGGLQYNYQPVGAKPVVGGWNRVRNINMPTVPPPDIQ